jgi:integrase
VIPVATLVDLLERVPERYRALLLLATFANLRFGELEALRRSQVDLDACEVRVTASLSEMDDGRLIDGDPKSRVGTRIVSFPADIVAELADRLDRGYGLQVHPAGVSRRDTRCAGVGLQVAPGPRAKCSGDAGVRRPDRCRRVAFDQMISALD